MHSLCALVLNLIYCHGLYHFTSKYTIHNVYARNGVQLHRTSNHEQLNKHKRDEARARNAFESKCARECR